MARNKIQLAGDDMFCNKCGQTVPEGSRFCNSCGTQTMAPVAVQDPGAALAADPDEQVMFTLRPTMIFVVVRYVIAALIVIAVAALMGLLASRVSGQVAFLVILGVGLISFANPIYHHIQRKREVYTLTNHKLEMRFGIIAKTMRNIPLRNIQDVTVTASVWQRFLNLGDIEIESASEAGKIILDDIHHPDRYTNMILAQLRHRN